MKAAGVIVLVVVILLVAAGVGWVIFARVRAQRLGLPPPAWSSFIPFRDASRSSSAAYGVQPAPGGIGAWFSDRLRSLKSSRNSRTAAGAYEGGGGVTGSRGAVRRGFGPLDPDEAWDARVGAEADAFYYNEEEQELGLHQQQPHGNATNTAYLGGGAYGGSSYDMNVPIDSSSTAAAAAAHDEPRGRSRDRSPNTNTTGNNNNNLNPNPNPFDDDAAPSNLSLRGVSPRPMADHGAAGASKNDADNSPTERKSLFRENV